MNLKITLSLTYKRTIFLTFTIVSAVFLYFSLGTPKSVFLDNRTFAALPPSNFKLVKQSVTLPGNSFDGDERDCISLSSGDFNGDGINDTAIGWAGLNPNITVNFGNETAIYPFGAKALEAREKGIYSNTFFTNQTSRIKLAANPDFVEIGNFDGDSHNFQDLIVAARGDNKIQLYSGDGNGNFAGFTTIDVTGQITTLTSGEMNRSDGLKDLIVAVSSDKGSKVLVYENPHGALNGEPEVFNFQNPVESLAAAQLDDDAPLDLAVAAGREITIISGRDRKLSLDENQRRQVPDAEVHTLQFDQNLRKIIAGDFHAHQFNDLALLNEDGEIFVLSRGNLDKHNLNIQRNLQNWGAQEILTGESLPGNTQILATRSGSFPADTLLIFNQEATEIHFAAVKDGSESKLSLINSYELESSPRLILPLRLNDDSLDDLLTINSEGKSAALVTTPQQIFTVNTTGDLSDITPADNMCADINGLCSFRAAIEQANASTGADEIQFIIPGSGLRTIQLNSFLPTAAPSLNIRGETQPGYAGIPLIELRRGNFAVDGSGASGLRITGNSRVAGLAFSNFFVKGAPIVYTLNITDGGNNQVENCRFGEIISNDRGIHITSTQNTIGGNESKRNLITNSCIGLTLSAPLGAVPNVIAGNYIISNNAFPDDGPCGHGIEATNFEGSEPDPQMSNDNLTIGGTTVGERNVISGNNPNQGKGIWLIGTKNVKIQGNFIGTDMTGLSSLPQYAGIDDGGSGTLIGGSIQALGNIISGNQLYGVALGAVSKNTTEATNAVLQNNYIGLDRTGENHLPNGDAGIVIATGSGNTIGGNSASFGNVISGNNLGRAFGILVQSGITGENIIIGNTIGLTASGGGGHGNGNQKTGGGVSTSGGGVKIGTTGGTSHNVISGNDGNGITVGGTGGNVIQGVDISNNYIGTDKNGNFAAFTGNHGNGVAIQTSVFASRVVNNRIAYNTGSGVSVVGENGQPNASAQILVQSNEIFSNGFLNLDLRNDRMIQDNDPQDPDTGANNLQNYPAGFTAEAVGTNINIQGTFNSFPNSTFDLRFYASAQCEGAKSLSLPKELGNRPVQTDAAGNTFFNFSLPLPASVPRNGYVQATAVDTTTIGLGNTSEYSPCVTIRHAASFDFDGDGKGDISVFRPSGGNWYLLNSTTGFSGVQFGQSADKLVPADYDGDGKTDVAVFRNGSWFWFRSLDSTFRSAQFGVAGDVPVPADFTGDKSAELTVFRNGNWYSLNLTNNQFTSVQFGQTADKPFAADFDGDGRADYGVYRGGNWYILQSSAGFTGVQFGLATDLAVPADYDGDGKTDPAVYRNGNWYVLQSGSGFTGALFGLSTDIPTPADYDGDGKADLAVYRNGSWYVQQSTAGFKSVSFGLSSDSPVPNVFVR